MANRFCASCGARLLRDANFCVECGERQPGASAPRVRFSVPVNRYAPLFVVLTVLLVGGGAVFYGTLNPTTPASVPRRDAPAASGTAAGGTLPQGHPPLEIPEQVKQAMRDMAQKAAAAPDDLDAWKRLAEVQFRAGQIDPSYLTEAATAYKHVLEREPDNLEVIRNLGNIAFDQEQPDPAVDYYQRYLKQKPDDLEVQTDLGTMYLSARKADEAIQAYQAVLKADPSFFQAQFNLAIAYRTLGDRPRRRSRRWRRRAVWHPTTRRAIRSISCWRVRKDCHHQPPRRQQGRGASPRMASPRGASPGRCGQRRNVQGRRREALPAESNPGPEGAAHRVDRAGERQGLRARFPDGPDGPRHARHVRRTHEGSHQGAEDSAPGDASHELRSGR